MLRTDLPQFDISENIIIGTDITEEILAFYKQPFRLKAGIFVLCLEGEIHASIKMTDYYIKKNDFVSILPGNILQFIGQQGKVRLCFVAFSSEFLSQTSSHRKSGNILKTRKRRTSCRIFFFTGENPGTDHRNIQYGNYQEHPTIDAARNRIHVSETYIESACPYPERRNPETVCRTCHATLYTRTFHLILRRTTEYHSATLVHDHKANHRIYRLRHYCPNGNPRR